MLSHFIHQFVPLFCKEPLKNETAMETIFTNPTLESGLHNHPMFTDLCSPKLNKQRWVRKSTEKIDIHGQHRATTREACLWHTLQTYFADTKFVAFRTSNITIIRWSNCKLRVCLRMMCVSLKIIKAGSTARVRQGSSILVTRSPSISLSSNPLCSSLVHSMNLRRMSTWSGCQFLVETFYTDATMNWEAVSKMDSKPPTTIWGYPAAFRLLQSPGAPWPLGNTTGR